MVVRFEELKKAPGTFQGPVLIWIDGLRAVKNIPREKRDFNFSLLSPSPLGQLASGKEELFILNHFQLGVRELKEFLFGAWAYSNDKVIHISCILTLFQGVCNVGFASFRKF